jgi:hypothetical protein
MKRAHLRLRSTFAAVAVEGPIMILKNLWRRKTRTLLTLLGIAIGVATVIVLSATRSA